MFNRGISAMKEGSHKIKFVSVFFGYKGKSNFFANVTERRGSWKSVYLPKWYHISFLHACNKRTRCFDFLICVYLLCILKGSYNNIVFHRPAYGYTWFFSFLRFRNPKVKIIFWAMDDLLKPHNYSKSILPILPNFDKIFNAKLTNIPYLKQNRLPYNYFLHPYCADTHLRSAYNSSHAFDVSFVGFYEKDRYESLVYLATKGVSVVVYGKGWPQNNIDNFQLNNYEVYGEDYINALKNGRISICFLRKLNNDSHTCRSLELPAMHQFFLAEYSDEHSDLYQCDSILFKNKDELFTLVKKFLKNSKLRNELASFLHKRVIEVADTFDEHVSGIERMFNNLSIKKIDS